MRSSIEVRKIIANQKVLILLCLSIAVAVAGLASTLSLGSATVVNSRLQLPVKQVDSFYLRQS
jgi:hypothetical protein